MTLVDRGKGQPGFDRRMTKEEINGCPISRYDGEIRVVRTPGEVASAVQALAREELLGFDTETRPAYKKGQSFPPALLQLAGREEVFVFQLKHTGLPAALAAILADGGIIKAGVALRDDILQLRKLADFEPAGFAGLATLAKEAGIRNHGLRGLAAVLLGFRISKGAQKTNWARQNLTPAQIRYAATDAWVGRQLYLKLKELVA